MKKLIFLGAILIVGSALMVSCSKKDIFEPNVSEFTTEPRQEEVVTNRPKFEDDGGDNYGCNGENGCCLAEVIIYGEKAPLQHVFTIIDNGDNTAISQSFQSNHQLLINFMDEQTVQDIIEHKLQVSHRNNQTQNKHYLLVKKDGVLNAVYPVSLRYKNEKTF